MNRESEIGALVIAHGSPDPDWVTMIHEIVKCVDVPIPLIPAFLEEGKLALSIGNGIQYLEEQGVRDIIVIPLFISEYTTHIDEIRYMLGIQPHNRPASDLDIPVLSHQSRIQICSPLNDHNLVIDILIERIKELYKPNLDEIVIVAHGVNDEQIFCNYQLLLDRLQQKVSAQLLEIYPTVKEHPVHYATFYPKTLATVVEHVALRKTPVVIPFFLSEGYFTKTTIPEKLNGLSYKYSGKTLLPHKNISSWIEEQIRKKLPV